MRRTVFVVLLAVLLVAVLCPVALGQTATPTPAPAQGATMNLSFSAVILVVGILVAIAIPTFLGARARAQDKAAESSLRNSIAAAKTYFTDGNTYLGWSPKVARQIEPSLAWTTDPPRGPTDVDIVSVTGKGFDSQVLMVSRSAGGTYFCIYDNTMKGTTYGQGPTLASVDEPSECSSTEWSV